MGHVQTEQPVVGEVSVRPPLMVRATASTLAPRAFPEDTPQAAADPTVQVRVDVPEAMSEVPKPSLQRCMELPEDRPQAVPVGAARLPTDGLLQFGQAFLPRLPKATAKAVAQKVEAFRPCVHDLRLGRMQRQAMVLDPALHQRQGSVRLLARSTQ